ncbi:MAG: aldo/keto reductase [Bryobacteraceae bacterium]|nr:aldo/keto reductase [Bryobacteraceae bacterium]
MKDPMSLPTRVLGRTGVPVSILGIGGWHIRTVKEDDEAIRIMHTAIGEGLTFFDNAWDYHDGLAEELMGRALAIDGKRNQVFLMTKDCERDYAGSMNCLEDSLRRLQTDHLDLWQFHEMVYDNDPEWVMERGGLRAAIEAREQGKVRFIGFTGHKDPRIHLQLLSKDFDWDTTMVPVNVMDPHYRSFINEVIPVCQQKNVGVIGMKGLGGGYPQGRFLESAGLTASECYRFCLSQEIAVQVSGITSMEQLKANLSVARDFTPMTSEEQLELTTRVREAAGDGRHELFKSTTMHDGPHHRRQHGFELAASA